MILKFGTTFIKLLEAHNNQILDESHVLNTQIQYPFTTIVRIIEICCSVFSISELISMVASIMIERLLFRCIARQFERHLHLRTPPDSRNLRCPRLGT